jgi:hypothetical protein
MAVVALLEGTRGERGPGQGPRRRLRPLAAWEFPGRPHRSALVAYLDA